MSNSREDSPDWLHSFQPPTKSAIELSSGSITPSERCLSSDEDDDSINLSNLFKKQTSHVSDIHDNSDGRESTVTKLVKGKSLEETENVKQTPKRKKNDDHVTEAGTKGTGNSGKRTPKKQGQPREQNHSIWSLSSDSEPSPNASPARRNGLKSEGKKDADYDLLEHDGESPLNQASNVKSPRNKMVKEDEKVSMEKNRYTDKIDENDGKNNVAREDVSGKHPGPQAISSRLPLLLSEKVQRLKALVEFEGDSIDLSGDVGAVGRVVISDDPSSNHEMFLDLKGTLDGFSFDSEDEVDNLPKAIAQTDQNEAVEDQPDVKPKRVKKTSGVTRKTGKSAVGKPSKKTKKKPIVPKQRKTKK